MKTNQEKYDFTTIQFGEKILDAEQYLNNEIAAKIYRKFHILVRFHL